MSKSQLRWNYITCIEEARLLVFEFQFHICLNYVTLDENKTFPCLSFTISKWSDNCCSFTKSCPALCDSMECSKPVSLSLTISRTLPKFMSIESVMPSNHLILCCPLLLCLPSFPASGSFPMSCLLTSGGQSIAASASVSVLPMNIQG